MLTKKTGDLICSLSKLDINKLKHIIQCLDDDSIECLCESVFNTIFTKLGISASKRNKIKSKLDNPTSRRNIKIITRKRSNIKKKRLALQQEGEGLGLILSTLAPIIASLFTK